MFRILSYNFAVAFEALLQNKTRAVLTSLGIICGVASVIAMLAIGKGAQEQILEKMKLLGSNNIIIKPVFEEDKKSENASEDNEETSDKKEQRGKKFSPGLTLEDAASINKVIPKIEKVCPETFSKELTLRKGFKRETYLVGVDSTYFSLNNFELKEGAFFTERQIRNSEPLCVVGSGVSSKLFPMENPIGKTIKCGRNWLKVIGVLKEKYISKENIKSLGIRDYNYDVYLPITSALIRYGDRSVITKVDLDRGRESSENDEPLNYHQLDKLTVQVSEASYVETVAEIISRMLFRRHNGNVDYEIVVPLALLEQEQKARRIFNIVLGAIASISLLVGGIGIMNIMLASVMERVKEIGIRRATGAKRSDILLQFLIEAVVISLSGGLIGVFGGFALSYIIEAATDITVSVSFWSVALSFFVSIGVGLIFGITPARKASMQDPIDLLRYE